VRTAYLPTILSIGALKLVCVVLTYAGPLLIGRMVSYIHNSGNDGDGDGNGDGGWDEGLVLVALFCTAFTGAALANALLSSKLVFLQSRLKGGLTALLVRRMARMSMVERRDSGCGDALAMNLIQVTSINRLYSSKIRSPPLHSSNRLCRPGLHPCSDLIRFGLFFLAPSR
jgi:hypothetical protein